MSSPRPYGDPETRARILRATLDLVVDRGPEFRLSDVAARSGVSRQAVYLHFGDRRGLLLALLAWIDEALNLGELLARVDAAPTGVEALDRMVETHAAYSPKIDAVARVLEAHQFQDAAVRAALDDRLALRRAAHRAVIARLAAEGRLASEWTVDSAADLFFAVTMQGPWRDLTERCGWSALDYAQAMSRLLHRTFVAESPARGSRLIR